MNNTEHAQRLARSAARLVQQAEEIDAAYGTLLDIQAQAAPFQPGQRVRLNDPDSPCNGQVVEVVRLTGVAPGVPRLYETRAEGYETPIFAEERELEAL